MEPEVDAGVVRVGGEADARTVLAEQTAHAAMTGRLKQILRELERHGFGRRAKPLPVEQLEFAPGEVQLGGAKSTPYALVCCDGLIFPERRPRQDRL
jgi:hypothetical protein